MSLCARIHDAKTSCIKTLTKDTPDYIQHTKQIEEVTKDDLTKIKESNTQAQNNIKKHIKHKEPGTRTTFTEVEFINNGQQATIDPDDRTISIENLSIKHGVFSCKIGLCFNVAPRTVLSLYLKNEDEHPDLFIQSIFIDAKDQGMVFIHGFSLIDQVVNLKLGLTMFLCTKNIVIRDIEEKVKVAMKRKDQHNNVSWIWNLVMKDVQDITDASVEFPMITKTLKVETLKSHLIIFARKRCLSQAMRLVSMGVYITKPNTNDCILKQEPQIVEHNKLWPTPNVKALSFITPIATCTPILKEVEKFSRMSSTYGMNGNYVKHPKYADIISSVKELEKLMNRKKSYESFINSTIDSALPKTKHRMLILLGATKISIIDTSKIATLLKLAESDQLNGLSETEMANKAILELGLSSELKSIDALIDFHITKLIKCSEHNKPKRSIDDDGTEDGFCRPKKAVMFNFLNRKKAWTFKIL